MSYRRPRVSIGLPVYNGERFIKQALDSILAQTFEDFELIISDNVSTDQTQAICAEYLRRDKRIRYFRNDLNIGVYRNCNRVFELSSGEYFKLAAADDICHPNLLAQCVKVLDDNPTVVLVYPKTSFIDENGKELSLTDPGWDLRSDTATDRMRYVISSGHWVNALFGLIRSGDLAKTRLLPTYNSGDYRLLGELSLRGKFFETPESLFYRRIHSEASSQNTDEQWQAKHFTGRSGFMSCVLWRLCFDHAVSVFSSQLNVTQKLSLISCILGRMVSGRRRLFMELAIAFNGYGKSVLRAKQ